ncbi:hypothetical protein VCHC51A1_0189 [Vibrio cholerae HC-51A1]|nr:hypothetical protein VCHE48_0211 [Vibrio cholerae HE48]EGS59536.1 hypothetical protein VCHE09_1039 [Vibrio paracholerae HE-09]EGS66122.1 hypothetical protein VCHC02A1_0191 [Vibrio cholerae HC-02A1]EHI09361.1 hypothetical protein VCHC48B2_0172 [Vibrio cholerae HC-48B2]EJH57664.1 hypothetical protein VCHC43B1_0231 [Vibrio cholerae HC-43B1]EJH66047.1 hypothetical protein VCHE45_0287 [Vibrio cholerae HE-45]EKG55619.1 hypothetical protein VCHC41A1_0201 [Vibrio cholerae HC-41A1]EKG65329.1 hypot
MIFLHIKRFVEIVSGLRRFFILSLLLLCERFAKLRTL